MTSQLVSTYAFNPVAGTVTLTGLTNPVKEQIRSIRRGTELIYSAADARNASLSGNVLTLPRGAVGPDFSASDPLVIMYDSDPGWSSSGTKYLRPGGGIPATDLSAGVQTSLGKADTAPRYPQLARDLGQIISGAVTRDANGAITSFAVVWPDGSPGIYTATALSTAFPGAVDSYTVTYGSPVTKTYTQPLVTRDTSGAVSILPAIVVS